MRIIKRLLAGIGEFFALLAAASAAAAATRDGRLPPPEVLRRLGIEPARFTAVTRV